MSNKNNLEQKAQRLIFESGDEGIMQSELWKKLGVSSREGSRLALKFEQKGTIERRKILHNGRWSYKLYSKKEYVTLDVINGCPCMICDEIDKCFEGGSKNPLSCYELSQWISPKS
ncbi:transcriptional regulator [Candidatus Bathyarchaeota archaeon]|nr:transcriptional regulator [Candidatus Bathyarchaeota archaeon]